MRDDAPRRRRTDGADRAIPCGGARTLPWTLLPSPTAIQPLIVGANDAARRALRCAARARASGCRRSGRRPCRREQRGCAFRCRPRTRAATWRHCCPRCATLLRSGDECRWQRFGARRRRERFTTAVARRVGRQRPAARAAARLGDARRSVRAGRCTTSRDIIACTSSICRATATRRRRRQGGRSRSTGWSRHSKARSAMKRRRSPCSAGRWAARSRCAGRVAPRSDRAAGARRDHAAFVAATIGRTRCATKRCRGSATSCARPTG